MVSNQSGTVSFGEGYHKRLCLRYSFVDIISPEGNISFFDKIVNITNAFDQLEILLLSL